MPYKICKIIEVETGHMLSKHTKNCKYPHGHSRKVELVLEANRLDKNDMVCDFAVIKTALGEFFDSFDHAMCINTDDPIFDTMVKTYGRRIIPFKHQDPTTEVIARMIYKKVHNSLKDYALKKDESFPLSKNVKLIRVRVWETSKCWAEYSE